MRVNTPRQILLVEDEVTDAALAIEALESLKQEWHVHHTNDGTRALNWLHRIGEYIEAPRVHLAFLDLNLPGRNGLSILEEVRKDDELSRIPIVVLSTSNRPEDVRRAYELGARGFIQKSFDYEDFVRSLSVACEYWLCVSEYVP